MWIRVLAIVFAYPLFACSCRQLTVCELIRRPIIFIGEVIEGGVESLKDDPWNTSVSHVRFKVLENFRGLPAGTQTVGIGVKLWPGMCSPNPYYPARRYLVVPAEHDGKLSDGICFSGRDVESASDEVGQVPDYFARWQSSNIRGSVAAAQDSDSIDYLLSHGEAMRLAGVRVYATRGPHIYSSVTDARGKYSLALPGPGKYTHPRFS